MVQTNIFRFYEISQSEIVTGFSDTDIDASERFTLAEYATDNLNNQ